MHKDKRALVETLRHYKRHILGPLFTEAADTIEELLKCCDALERDNDSLCATIDQQKAQIITLTAEQEPAHWIFKAVTNDPEDPLGLFRHRYECSACHMWQTYGMTKHCPNCGAKMEDENG